MVHSITSGKTDIIIPVGSKSTEESQVIANVAQEALVNITYSSDKPFAAIEVEIPDEEVVKEKLKALLCFDKFCEMGKAKGAEFSQDGKYVVDFSGKRRVVDLEHNHAIMRNAMLSYVEMKGCQNNPVTGLLMNGTIETVELTFVIMTLFFKDKELMADLETKMINKVYLDYVWEGIDYEVVKSTVKLFMECKSFISVLKEKGWHAYAKDQKWQFVSSSGAEHSQEDILAKWKSQKNKVLQSITDCGFGYSKQDGSFKRGSKTLTLDDVYDLIKDLVLEQLITEAGEMGYSFDIERNLFIKDGSEATVREIIIQANLKRMKI